MKISGLTGTRAIAALWVVIHHYGSDLLPFSLCGLLFKSGNLAVSYFFVLSGFVMYITQQSTPAITFYRNRLARIAPPYLFALLLTILIIICYYPTPPGLTGQILTSTFFIQAFFPSYVLELNSPGWSVSVEMVFYLLFPVLLFASTRTIRVILAVTAVFFVVSQYIHLRYWQEIGPLTGSGIYFNPLIHFSEFMAGMAAGMLYSKGLIHIKWPMLLAAFVTTISLICFRPPAMSYHVGLLAPLYVILIIGIAQRRNRLLDSSIMIFLGEISYGIYIYQYPVYKFVRILNQKFFGLSNSILFYISLMILLLVSAASYKLLELPTIRFFKRKFALKPIHP